MSRTIQIGEPTQQRQRMVLQLMQISCARPKKNGDL